MPTERPELHEVRDELQAALALTPLALPGRSLYVEALRLLDDRVELASRLDAFVAGVRRVADGLEVGMLDYRRERYPTMQDVVGIVDAQVEALRVLADAAAGVTAPTEQARGAGAQPGDDGDSGSPGGAPRAATDGKDGEPR